MAAGSCDGRMPSCRIAPTAHSTGCLTSCAVVPAKAGSVNIAFASAVLFAPEAATRAAASAGIGSPDANRYHSRVARKRAFAGWASSTSAYPSVSKVPVLPRIVLAPGSYRRGLNVAVRSPRWTCQPVSARAAARTSASV